MREQLINKLKESQNQVSTLLASMANNQDWQLDLEAWSFRYIAAHITTVEKDCFKDRIMRIATGENPHFEYYLNTGWDFSQFDLEDSLRTWAVTRQEIIDLVQALPVEKLSLAGTHVTFGKITVLDVLQMMLDHDQEHLQELEQMIAEYRGKSSAARADRGKYSMSN